MVDVVLAHFGISHYASQAAPPASLWGARDSVVSGTLYVERPPPFRSAGATLHSELRRNEDVAPLAQHRLTFSQSSKGLATPP